MGQAEVYELLKKKKRLTVKEIAELIHDDINHVSHAICRMIDKEVYWDKPNKEEIRRILEKYPKSKNGLWRIKVYYTLDED